MRVWDKLIKFLLLRLQKGKLEKESILQVSGTPNQITRSQKVFYL